MRSTVFVLGAGASCPFGYPTGRELREEITDLRWLGQHESVTWPSSTFEKMQQRRARIQRHGQLLQRMGLPLQAHTEMAHEFFYSGSPSIDAFVATRPEFADAAKVTIAAALLACEQWDALFSLETNGNWYEWIWNKLVGTANLPDEIDFRRFRFFSFNYDRSLEAYFFRALRARFKLTNELAVEWLSKLNIVHAYGALSDVGAFCNDLPAFAHGSMPDCDSVSSASKNLKLIPEHRGDIGFETASWWFDESRVICFLGYGFDPLNDKRLGLAKKLEKRDAAWEPTVLSTTYGLVPGEIESVRTRIVGSTYGWYPVVADCLNGLRSWSREIG